MIVLAVDPGKTTGWALFNYPKDTVSTGQNNWLDVARWIDQFSAACHEIGTDLTLVSESFIITQATIRKSRQSWSLEFIGLLKYWALERTKSELVLQSAADGKSFSTNDKLKALGWYTPGQDHANDAARHLLLYAVRSKLINPALVIQ